MIRLCPLSTKQTRLVTAITKATINRAIIGNIDPVLTNSKSPPRELGRPATIPAKIINEIPFPNPRSVICSPSHMRNIVPVTNVTTVVNLNNKPGSITRLG